MAKILVVDDNVELLSMLGMVLRSAGYSVETARNGNRLEDLISSMEVDLVITDVIMPDTEGMEVMMFLKKLKIPFLVMSGGGGLVSVEEVFALAKRLGACAILEKPFQEADMLSAVEMALKNNTGR